MYSEQANNKSQILCQIFILVFVLAIMISCFGSKFWIDGHQLLALQPVERQIKALLLFICLPLTTTVELINSIIIGLGLFRHRPCLNCKQLRIRHVCYCYANDI